MHKVNSYICFDFDDYDPGIQSLNLYFHSPVLLLPPSLLFQKYPKSFKFKIIAPIISPLKLSVLMLLFPDSFAERTWAVPQEHRLHAKSSDSLGFKEVVVKEMPQISPPTSFLLTHTY